MVGIVDVLEASFNRSPTPPLIAPVAALIPVPITEPKPLVIPAVNGSPPFIAALPAPNAVFANNPAP